MVNQLKQHLRSWHCKHFTIGGFTKYKWMLIKESALYLGITPSSRKNIYRAPMMYQDTAAHQGPLLPSCKMGREEKKKKEENKTKTKKKEFPSWRGGNESK